MIKLGVMPSDMKPHNIIDSERIKIEPVLMAEGASEMRTTNYCHPNEINKLKYYC